MIVFSVNIWFLWTKYEGDLTSFDFRDAMSRSVEMCCFAEFVSNTLQQNSIFCSFTQYVINLRIRFEIEFDHFVSLYLIYAVGFSVDSFKHNL